MFGYWDKESADNQGRDEKRYLERQNKAEQEKQRKAEGGRKLKLIDTAYAADPRRKKCVFIQYLLLEREGMKEKERGGEGAREISERGSARDMGEEAF